MDLQYFKLSWKKDFRSSFNKMKLVLRQFVSEHLYSYCPPYHGQVLYSTRDNRDKKNEKLMAAAERLPVLMPPHSVLQNEVIIQQTFLSTFLYLIRISNYGQLVLSLVNHVHILSGCLLGLVFHSWCPLSFIIELYFLSWFSVFIPYFCVFFA